MKYDDFHDFWANYHDMSIRENDGKTAVDFLECVADDLKKAEEMYAKRYEDDSDTGNFI